MRLSNYTSCAKADLTAIYDHIFQQDPPTAALIVDRIELTVESVCVFPQIGKLTNRPDIWVFGGSQKMPFRITYRFDDEILTVVRIFRASREHTQF